jgi:hypothetical protein
LPSQRRPSKSTHNDIHVKLLLGNGPYFFLTYKAASPIVDPCKSKDIYHPEGVAIIRAIREKIGADKLVFMETPPDIHDRFDKAAEAAQGVDCIVLCLVEALFGDVNPSGKLPFTYPAGPNAFATHDHSHSEAYVFKPLFPFGWKPDATVHADGESGVRKPARRHPRG